MPLRLLSIEKEATFQGKTERWSNVYCYDTNVSTASEMTALVNAVVALEQPIHGTVVAFKRARIYTRQGLNAGDPGNMYHVQELTAAGTATYPGPYPLYRELAVLIKLPMARKVFAGGQLGRQRSLKKWYHPCTSFHLSSTGIMEGTATIGTVAAYTTLMSGIQVPVSGSQLVSPYGDPPNAAGQIHGYLEHRQFPRGRKES